MCTGDCSTCGSQCPISKLAEKFRKEPETKAESKDNTTIPTNKEETQTMSQSPITCHSGPDEKIVSHGERINALSASGKCCIGCLALTAVAVIGGCLYLNGKIGDVQLKQAEELTKVKTEYSIRIDALEKAVAELKSERNELKSYVDESRRAYEAAKKFRQRHGAD